jgi:GrpB-like predicted nucleotidyltransferase (UPF0157 family)
VIDFAAVGLGLQYGTVALVRADEQWGAVAEMLSAKIEEALVGVADDVEHIGSTSVPGLLAKPIVDLAIGMSSATSLDDVEEPLSRLGWIYRGDAGDDGGLVFVLEDSPWHRVAHAHGVEFGGGQWCRYLQFRELLRRDAAARRTYEDAKLKSAARFPDGRKDYLAGKDPTVRQLLASQK